MVPLFKTTQFCRLCVLILFLSICGRASEGVLSDSILKQRDMRILESQNNLNVTANSTKKTFPYTYAEKEYFYTQSSILLGCIAWFGFAQYQMSELEWQNPAPKSELAPWDRPFAGTHSETARNVSDVLIAGALLPPVWMWSMGKDRNESQQYLLQDLWGLSQLMFFSSGLNLLTRSLVHQPRPLVYSTDNTGPESLHSFYSGHTSAAFALAAYYSTMASERYPNATSTPYLIWGGFALAGTEGLLRIGAGKHYPSDVLVGALIGGGLGWFFAKQTISGWGLRMGFIPGTTENNRQVLWMTFEKKLSID